MPAIMTDRQAVAAGEGEPTAGNSSRRPLVEGQAGKPGTKVAEVPPANLGAGVVPPSTKGAAWGPPITNKASTKLPTKEGAVWLPQINTMVEC